MANIQDGSAKFVVRDKRLQALVDFFFPVGTIVVRDADDRPEFLSYGKWEQIAPDRVLQGFKGGGTPVGSDVEAGLPNITGSFGKLASSFTNAKNAFYLSGALSISPQGGFGNLYYAPTAYDVSLDASQSNPIYGNSDTVQPKAHIVIYWKRVE